MWEARQWLIVGIVMITMSGAAYGQSLFSPDGQTIATVSSDNTIMFLESGAVHKKVIAGRHDDTVNTIAFSHDGLRLVSASDDRSVKVWAAPSGELLLTLSVSEAVADARFSSNGQRILTRTKGGELALWYANDGGSVALLNEFVDVVGADVSADGSRIVATQANGLVSMWDEHASFKTALHAPESVEPAGVMQTPQQWAAATPSDNALLAGWAKSWAEQNTESYLAYYEQGYAAKPKQTPEQWRAIRKQKISAPTRINVSFANLQTRQLDKDNVEMKFSQRYESDRFADQCIKHMIWSMTDQGRRITSEQTRSCR